MQRLDRAAFEACSDDFDRAVAGDTEIDAFCSRSAWILSFAAAFRPTAELCIARGSDAFVALAAVAETGIGTVLQPLESMWGFASPIVGGGAAELLDELLADTAARGPLPPLLLTGLPAGRTRLEPVLRVLAARFALRPLPVTVRYQASLVGGRDGWLARRSVRFRRNLRAARRRVRAAGVEFASSRPLDAPATAEIYARAVAIESRSWKASTENGIHRGPMYEFYARMLPRLAARGELRVLFATRDGVDLGYLYGGVAGDLFRGLQFSFREDTRELGLGNVLQAEMIDRLCAEGFALYGLGAQSAYKRLWAEEGLVTAGLLARPRR